MHDYGWIEEITDYPMEDSPDELLYLINVRVKMIEDCMYDKKINRRRFDVYSYMLWAINFFLDNLYDCSAHVDIPTIRNLICIHIDEYKSWIEKSRGNHERWDAALEAMENLKLISDWFV